MVLKLKRTKSIVINISKIMVEWDFCRYYLGRHSSQFVDHQQSSRNVSVWNSVTNAVISSEFWVTETSLVISILRGCYHSPLLNTCSHFRERPPSELKLIEFSKKYSSYVLGGASLCEFNFLEYFKIDFRYSIIGS